MILKIKCIVIFSIASSFLCDLIDAEADDQPKKRIGKHLERGGFTVII